MSQCHTELGEADETGIRGGLELGARALWMIMWLIL